MSRGQDEGSPPHTHTARGATLFNRFTLRSLGRKEQSTAGKKKTIMFCKLARPSALASCNRTTASTSPSGLWRGVPPLNQRARPASCTRPTTSVVTRRAGCAAGAAVRLLREGRSSAVCPRSCAAGGSVTCGQTWHASLIAPHTATRPSRILPPRQLTGWMLYTYLVRRQLEHDQ